MVLQFKKANCKNCYKCLRECPVKSIRVIDHQAQIMEDKCILCGHCTKICPQDAKTVRNDIDVVRDLLNGDRKVIVSLAPSYVAAFPDSQPEQFINALYELGFDEVQETAIGAKYVSREYNRLLESGVDNLITSACPSVVRLIRQYHPAALRYLAKVDSPMVAHAKLIREREPDAAIVFVGPCISKKREAEESGIIDAALTFEEIADWLSVCHVNPSKEPLEYLRPTVPCDHPALNYPVNRGIIKSMGAYRDGYDYICVDGVDKCREVLDNMDSLHGFFIEMSACENACVNGPCMTCPPGGFIKSTELVRRYAKNRAESDRVEPTDETFLADYSAIPNVTPMPSESELKSILAQVGKHRKEDLLNCGACGYATCIENAIAVYNGNAEPGMCVPYMRDRAERIAAKIIDNSPNGILAVDENMRIVELNARAKELLGFPDLVPAEAQLSDYLNPTEYILAMENGTATSFRGIYLDKTDRYVDLMLAHIPQTKMVFGIYTDVTDMTRQKERMTEARKQTVATADEVIEKQMRIVQEIASLLGETAAETQVALSKLKHSVEEEE